LSKIDIEKIEPTEFKVIIKPVKIEDVTSGGIIMPDITKDSEKHLMTKGEIISMSHLAFSYATDEEWDGNKPQIGDGAMYAKFSGVHFEASNGDGYILLNDKDIVATIRK